MSQITEPVAQLLKGKNFAYVSTLMKDGSPQVTSTWVDIEKDGNSILINTAEGRIKHKNVSRDPRVAISISDHNNPYNMVSIRGRVIEQITEGADEHTNQGPEFFGIDQYIAKIIGSAAIKLSNDSYTRYNAASGKLQTGNCVS